MARSLFAFVKFRTWRVPIFSGSTSATMSLHDEGRIRELRQHASDLVRRVEHGETVTVTVSGREVALQLGPLQRMQWRTWDDIVSKIRRSV